MFWISFANNSHDSFTLNNATVDAHFFNRRLDFHNYPLQSRWQTIPDKFVFANY